MLRLEPGVSTNTNCAFRSVSDPDDAMARRLRLSST
jgi:hypothetical protein